MNFSSLSRAFKGTGTIAANVGIGAGLNMALNKDNMGTAIMKELPWSIAYAMIPGTLAFGAQIAPELARGVVAGGVALNNLAKTKWKDTHTVGPRFTYQDTQQALTMRQASVQAIQGSKLNARNALGGEASLMHRGYGDRRL